MNSAGQNITKADAKIGSRSMKQAIHELLNAISTNSIYAQRIQEEGGYLFGSLEPFTKHIDDEKEAAAARETTCCQLERIYHAARWLDKVNMTLGGVSQQLRDCVAFDRQEVEG